MAFVYFYTGAFFMDHFIYKIHMKLIASALPLELRVAKQFWWVNEEYQYLATWVWSAQTIFSLTQYLSEHKLIQEIMFFWICGYLESAAPLIQVANTRHATNTKEYILPISAIFAPLESMYTTDTAIHDTQVMKNVWMNYVDMESWWVAMVADRLKIKCTILRVPYDKVGSLECWAIDKQDMMNAMTVWLKTLI